MVRYTDTVKYAPVLAKEGIKHEVGSRGMRSELLVVNPALTVDGNTLQLVSIMDDASDSIPPARHSLSRCIEGTQER